MRICVFCASSPEIHSSYFEATKLLAEELFKNNIEVVYGGGAIGLMGILADTIIGKGGKIKGIIPGFMYDLGWANKDLTELVITDTMHERKAKYLEDIDGIIALPGGSGTLEELLEVITLKRLGRFSKPIIILNANRFYEPLKKMLGKCIDEKFMEENDREMWTFIDDPSDIMECLLNA